MWDLIVSVPDQCLSFYFEKFNIREIYTFQRNKLFHSLFSRDCFHCNMTKVTCKMFRSALFSDSK